MQNYIIYNRFGKWYGTNEQNYLQVVMNANQIQAFNGFTSGMQVKEYLLKYTNLKDNNITIMEG